MTFKHILVTTWISTVLVVQATDAIAQTSGHVSSPGLIPPAPVAPTKANNKPPIDSTQPVVAVEPALRQAAPSGPSVDQGGGLDLMCFGGGAANKPTLTTVHGTHGTSGTISGNHGEFATFDGSGSSSATIIGQRSQGFEDQVSLRIQGGEGQLRMPRTMLPPVHGGSDGWFKLKDIKIQPNEITATVAVNFINSPKLRLDRYAGTISISGKAGDFTGRCQRFEPEHAQRQF